MKRRGVGSILRRWRQERGLTQEWMEQATGLRQGYLSCLERDAYADPGALKLHKVVGALGRTMDELMHELSKDDNAARRQPAMAA